MLFINFIDIIEKYISIGDIIYLSIGSAANIHSKGIDKLQEHDNQQYPPFLDNIKNIHDKKKTHIILIDPYLTKPPYIINDIRNFDRFDRNEQFYENYEKLINVYAFNEYVHYFHKDKYYNSTYITPSLNLLNQKCLCNNWTLIVHDFSGRDINILADIFDRVYENNNDQIIYDINNRVNDGCYVNLTKISSKLKFYIEDEIIKLRNPFNKKYRETNNAHILYNNKWRIIHQYVYPLYRTIFYGLRDNNIRKNMHPNEFFFVVEKYDKDIYNSYKRGEYNKIINILEEILRLELMEMFDCENIVNDKIELLQQEENRYKWMQMISFNDNC